MSTIVPKVKDNELDYDDKDEVKIGEMVYID